MAEKPAYSPYGIDPDKDYEHWKFTQRQGVDNTFGLQDTSREAYDQLAASQRKQESLIGTTGTTPTTTSTTTPEESYQERLDRIGEIYATPDNTLSNIHQANRRVLGGQGVGSLEAAGMPEVWNPISDVALEATGGAMFGRFGKAWQAARRALGYGDEAAEGAAKTVAKTATPKVAQEAPEWAANWTPQLGQKMTWSHPMAAGLDPGQAVHVIDKGTSMVTIAPKAYAYPAAGRRSPGSERVVPGGLLWRILVEGDEHAAKQLEKLTGSEVVPNSWHPVIRAGETQPRVEVGDFVTMFSPGVELAPLFTGPVSFVSGYLR